MTAPAKNEQDTSTATAIGGWVVANGGPSKRLSLVWTSDTVRKGAIVDVVSNAGKSSLRKVEKVLFTLDGATYFLPGKVA